MDIISTKFINRIFPVIFIMMFASITAQTAHAGSLGPESAMKEYTKAEKTCKKDDGALTHLFPKRGNHLPVHILMTI